MLVKQCHKPFYKLMGVNPTFFVWKVIRDGGIRLLSYHGTIDQSINHHQTDGSEVLVRSPDFSSCTGWPSLARDRVENIDTADDRLLHGNGKSHRKWRCSWKNLL